MYIIITNIFIKINGQTKHPKGDHVVNAKRIRIMFIIIICLLANFFLLFVIISRYQTCKFFYHAFSKQIIYDRLLCLFMLKFYAIISLFVSHITFLFFLCVCLFCSLHFNFDSLDYSDFA